MTSALTIHSAALPESRDRLLGAALVGLSTNSCRVYTRHLKAFIGYLSLTRSQIHREAVVDFLESGYGHDLSSYNQALSAIKRLATQAAENSWLSWHIARAIDSIPCKQVRGIRTGTWLTLDQTRALLALPDSTLRGRRDAALLSLFLGCGLRREEISTLDASQLQRRDSRTLLCDILGKGNRYRTVAVPPWTESRIRTWLSASGITCGPLIRAFTPAQLMGGRLSATGIWQIVDGYANRLGIRFTPHDLRRTYAKLARKAGAPIEVIQKSLGHSTVSTTEKYMRTGEESNAGEYIDL